ncbi:MAG: hypothetical protein LBO04_07640 [Spirochaetaceae bacterium]|nr:hypothetical protein [Spirochaetaceae bacterium]
MGEIVTWEDRFRSIGKLQEWEARGREKGAAEREQLGRENEQLRAGAGY